MSNEFDVLKGDSEITSFQILVLTKLCLVESRLEAKRSDVLTNEVLVRLDCSVLHGGQITPENFVSDRGCVFCIWDLGRELGCADTVDHLKLEDAGFS